MLVIIPHPAFIPLHRARLIVNLLYRQSHLYHMHDFAGVHCPVLSMFRPIYDAYLRETQHKVKASSYNENQVYMGYLLCCTACDMLQESTNGKGLQLICLTGRENRAAARGVKRVQRRNI